MRKSSLSPFLLAVDIGNTNIKLALFKGKRIVANWRLATEKGNAFKQYTSLLKKLFRPRKVKKLNLEQIIICSVVPKLTLVFKKILFSIFKKRPLILGQDIIVPIKNLYGRPEQVGQDRLANAAAALSKYRGPIIVVDFGTALTFDVVSAKGSYLGGVIVPGMELSLQALINNAALLPKICLSKPGALLGRETAYSMKSGIVYGYSFLVEGILQQLKKRFKLSPQVVATGGEAHLMASYCRSIDRIERNLTLEGIMITYGMEFQKEIPTTENRTRLIAKGDFLAKRRKTKKKIEN